MGVWRFGVLIEVLVSVFDFVMFDFVRFVDDVFLLFCWLL